MCSCLPAFAGFFGYHLPLIRSIIILLSSTFKGGRGLKTSSRSSDPSTCKILRTKDLRITLGSRVDGRGYFVNQASILAREGEQPQRPVISYDTLSHIGPASICASEGDRPQVFKCSCENSSPVEAPAGIYSSEAGRIQPFESSCDKASPINLPDPTRRHYYEEASDTQQSPC